MKIDELIEHLETDAEWAFANEWESPICLSDDINDALTILRTIAILNRMDILDKIKYVLEDYL
jgi:hypothetical protein